ncbi:MAG: hypothetical protein OXB88_06245 [Bacteriovoracales bacterium]|nr:hypothetical protein [Bacteriovoracales bacterium]
MWQYLSSLEPRGPFAKIPGENERFSLSKLSEKVMENKKPMHALTNYYFGFES